MKAIVIGSTGLVGEHLLQLLEKDARFSEVIALVRKPSNQTFVKVNQQCINFNNLTTLTLSGNVLFCALGTTLKKAGSKEAQFLVDYTYNLNAALAAKQSGVKILAHVSSIGADASSNNFYLKTKGKLEQDLKALEFEKTIIVRPSIILGNRKEFRLGEKIGIAIVTAFSFLMIGALKKYKGVHAKKIAACLIEQVCNKNTVGFNIVESDVILKH